ncbi:MAG: YHS domain-containing (seleno)protein [Paracoccaceae bacterium]
MRRILTAALAAAALWAGAAAAGEQYVDESGHALSGYDVVAYFDKDQSPIGEAQPAPTPGKASITAEWNGAVWAFASEENRERFLADPEAYAPQYDGHCAFGVAKGGKVPGDPERWRIVDGKLYLNLQRSVQEMWLGDIPGHLEASESNWPGLEDEPATDREVPELEPGAAPVPG